MVLFEIAKARYLVYAIGKNERLCPLLDFLASVGSNLRKDSDRILALLERVSQKGPPRITDISHQIKGDLFEFIQGRLRVLWFYDEGRMVICTQGFVKKARKTPSAEIEKAISLKENYLQEKRRGALKIIKRESI